MSAETRRERERVKEAGRRVVHKLSEWYFAQGGDESPDAPFDRADLDVLHEVLDALDEYEAAANLWANPEGPNYLAECENCGWFLDGHTALGLAARHHDATGHTVHVLVQHKVIYEKRERYEERRSKPQQDGER